jgi:hypothetical protein
MISLYSRSHRAGRRGARAFSIVLLLLFLVLPVSASTRADATRAIPEALPLIFELNAEQTKFRSQVPVLRRGLSVPEMLAAGGVLVGAVDSRAPDIENAL